MRFWKLLTYLWRSGGSNDDRRRVARRVPTMDSLSETDVLEGRCVRSTLWTDRDVSGRPRAAEVVHVPSHGMHQAARTQSQFFRLSVVIVDYLLEYEWLSLLGGYRRRSSGERRERRGPRDGVRRAATEYAEPVDESNRTACIGESPWSIVAAIEQPPPPGSTTATDE